MTLSRQFRLRSFVLFSHTLQRIPVLSPKTDEARFAPGTAADAETFRDYEDGVMTRREVQAKLRGGELFYLIKIGGERAWMAWARLSLFLHVPWDQWIHLPPGVADVYGVFTKPQYRNLGLARFGYAELLRDLRARGCSRATLQVEQGNAPSLRSVAAAGFDQYAQLSYARCGPMRFYRATLGGTERTAHWAVRKQSTPWFNRLMVWPEPLTGDF